MQSVTGIFATAQGARRGADRLRAAGIPDHQVTILFPHSPDRDADRRVPTEDAESPGMGAAVGGTVGAAVGLATASLVLPGLGTILVAGALAAAGGGAIGSHLEEQLTRGLPHDELRRYLAAVRDGRSVVVVVTDSDARADAARSVLEGAGAETVDAAREDWMSGLTQSAP
jgi:outer membrane lipoprotein SlyB